MVKKIFGFFYRETGSLNQAAMLLGLFAFLSQVLAFLRDRFLAHLFGAGNELDIYYAAFRIPDFIFVTVASIVSLSVLIPFILEKEAAGREKLREFIDSVFAFFGVIVVLAALAAYALIPYLAETLFSGFSPEELEEVILLSRVLLFSPIVLGFSNLFGSITQAYNRFAIYALAPLLYNIGIIAGIVMLAPEMGVRGVAIGVVVGALLHALIQVPFVIETGLFPRLRLKVDWGSVKKVAVISFPRTLTLSMSSLVLILLVSIASVMDSGAISVLSFSINLQSVPLSIIGVSYSLAAFPTLSRRFKENDIQAFIEQMALSARFIIFWSLPLTALLIVLRAQVVRVILGTGLFDWDDTRLTAAALALFVLSSVFQGLLLLFMRGFYSAGETYKPFFINLVSTVILIALSYGLVETFYVSDAFSGFVSALLKVEDLSNTAVLMLPLAFSIGTSINVLLLWIAFEKRFKGMTKKVIRTLFESFSVSLIMGTAAYVALNLFQDLFDTTTLMGIFSQGFAAGAVAIIIGSAVFVLLKNREAASVWSVVRGKFWKAKVIATDPEIV